jgi:hypothetical protein
MAKPAARTAADCTNPAAILVPTGNACTTGVPISSTKNETQSVRLCNEYWPVIQPNSDTYVREIMTSAKTQVCVEGNK